MKLKLLFIFLFMHSIVVCYSQDNFELQVTVNKKYLGCYLNAGRSFIYPKKIADTQFTIKGSCRDEFELLHFEIQETSIISRFDLFISNSKMKVKINNISINQPFNINFIEVPLKKEQEKYLLVQQANNIKLTKINTLARDDLYDSLYSVIAQENKRINVEFIKQNPSSYISFYCLENDFVRYKKLDPDSLFSLYTLLTNDYVNKQRGLDLKANIIELENKFNQNNLHSKFPSFNFKSSTNKQFSFDELSKNKTALIIFWASWCGPCRREIPTLKNIYEKFSSKNFEMISISLDKDTIQWRKALDDEKMPWLQSIDNNSFIKNICFQNFLYHNMIPLCIVIKNGEIIYNTYINEDSGDCKKLIETLNANINYLNANIN